MMDARIPPTDKIGRLSHYQFNMIIKIAVRNEPICARADRLKALDFCTDAVKFEVLKKSRKIDDETYQALYDLYFGVVEKDDDEKPEKEPQENKPNESETAPKSKRDYVKWDEADVMTLIHYYNKGVSADELAKMFNRDKRHVWDKIKALKKNEKYKELFTMSKEKPAEKPQEQEDKTENVAASTDAEVKTELPKDNEPEPFCAEGTGLISTDAGLKLDDEPILAALRKEIVDSGNVQFYGTVQIIITPHKPTGMKVSRGVRNE